MITTHSETQNRVKLAIIRFGSLVRWDEWGASKLPFVFIAWSIVAIQTPGNTKHVFILLEMISYTAFFLAFGYVFNDWMDRIVDQRAGKLKLIQSFKNWQVYFVLGTLFLGSIISLLRWLSHLPIGLTVIACYFFAITYSGTNFRFKERGQWGLFVASLSQRTLPCMLVFFVMGWQDVITPVYLTLTLIIGLRWMLAHQLGDLENDKQSQVKTYATQKNAAFIKTYMVWVFNLELILVVVLGLALSYPPLWLVYLAYFILSLVFTYASKSTPWQMLQTSSSAYVVLADFYFIYWPLGFALLLSLHSPYMFASLVFLAFLQLRYIRQHISDLKGIYSSRKENG